MLVSFFALPAETLIGHKSSLITIITDPNWYYVSPAIDG